MEGLPPWIEVVVSLVVFFVGGGTVGPWLTKYLRAGQQAETEAILKQKFASLDDANGIGRKLSAMETLYVQHTDRIDDIQDRILKLETITQERWERISQQMQETANALSRVMEQVRQVSDAQIRLSTLIEERRREK